MDKTRILIGIITAPVWLPLFATIAFFAIAVFAPIWLALLIIALLEYVFKGDKDLLQQMGLCGQKQKKLEK